MVLIAATAVAIVLLVAFFMTVAGRPRLGPAVLVVTAVAWPFVNHPFEGPVLWTVARGHGLTLSDLLTPVALVTAVVAVAARRRLPAADQPGN